MNPLPSCAQSLPSTDQLCEAPQLAALAALQASLRLTAQVLDIQHPELGSRRALVAEGDTDSVIAQLIIDRCRELAELVTCYRLALHPNAACCIAPDDDPF